MSAGETLLVNWKIYGSGVVLFLFYLLTEIIFPHERIENKSREMKSFLNDFMPTESYKFNIRRINLLEKFIIISTQYSLKKMKYWVYPKSEDIIYNCNSSKTWTEIIKFKSNYSNVFCKIWNIVTFIICRGYIIHYMASMDTKTHT